METLQNDLPIRRTLRDMARGSSQDYPIKRYDSVISTVSSLHRLYPMCKWTTAISEDKTTVKVTRVD